MSKLNDKQVMNEIDEIIYKETQKAAYEEQCEQVFVYQEQPNEGRSDYAY